MDSIKHMMYDSLFTVVLWHPADPNRQNNQNIPVKLTGQRVF